MDIKDDLPVKTLGSVAELKFQYEALRRGLQVSVPITDNLKYDVIIANDRGKVFRVQIKSCQNVEKKHLQNYRFNTSSGATGKLKYSVEDVDIFALYIFPLDLFYFIPIKQITGISTRVNPADKNHRYEIYRDFWRTFA